MLVLQVSLSHPPVFALLLIKHAVVLSFLLAGISALISSLCYRYTNSCFLLLCFYSFVNTHLIFSEFAARIPVSGSTFSYVYISLGEFPGWMYVLSNSLSHSSYSSFYILFLYPSSPLLSSPHFTSPHLTALCPSLSPTLSYFLKKI